MSFKSCCPDDHHKSMQFKRCVPISSVCDEETETFIYSSSTIPNDRRMSGIVSVVNTSISCDITVNVTDSNGTFPSTVSPQSTVVIQVTKLQSITFYCSGGDDSEICTGTFELDLFIEKPC